jgi:hypothetical protein
VPGNAANRGADQLSEPGQAGHSRRFQVLALDVDVATDDDEVALLADFVAQGAGQTYPATQSLRLDVATEAGEYVVRVDDVELSRCYTPEAVVEDLFTAVYAHVVSLFPAHCLIRGAVGRVGARRFLVCGARGSGITTLALRLLYDGAQMEGDALAFLGADGITALPRRFHLPSATGQLVPEVDGRLGALPSLQFSEDRLFAFDPGGAGFAWAITSGPVDDVIWLEPNHGGQTRAATMAHVEMARRVMGRTSPPPGGGTAWVGALTSLVGQARCIRLDLGTVDDGAKALVALLETASGPG